MKNLTYEAQYIISSYDSSIRDASCLSKWNAISFESKHEWL